MLLTFVELIDGKEQEDQGAISLCDGNFAVYSEEKHMQVGQYNGRVLSIV